MATLQTFGGGTTDLIFDPSNGGALSPNAPYTIIDATTMLPATGLQDASGAAVTQLVSDADARYAGSAMLEGVQFYIRTVGTSGKVYDWGPLVSTQAIADVVEMGPQLDGIAASAAASAFAAKQAQAAAEAVQTGSATTNASLLTSGTVDPARLPDLSATIDARLGGDATGLVPTVAPLVKATSSRIAFGKQALNALPASYDIGTSGSVVALGYGAMQNVTAVKTAIAIGPQAMGNGTVLRENIAIGGSALRNVQATSADYSQVTENGTRNNALGSNAGYFAQTVTGLNAVGRNAASCITAGVGLTVMGHNACGGYAPVGLSGVIENHSPWGSDGATIRTTAIGNSAAQRNMAGNVVAIGGEALSLNKKSDNNTAVGARALVVLDSGTGYGGGTSSTLNLSGSYSWAGTTLTVTATGHGFSAGDFILLRLLDGGGATFALDVARALVATAPDANTLTIREVVSGQAIQSLTASGNATILGRETAAQAAVNNNNTAVGTSAGSSMTTGTSNTFVGNSAAAAATTSSQSSAIGGSALAAASSLTNCAVNGFNAAAFITGAANQVTALGASALRNKVDGTTLTDATFTNITGIGYDSRVSGANQVQLGNTAATVYAQAAVQTRSDARDKADVQDTALGLSFIEKLRPVDYRWDRREDYAPLDPETGEVVHLERDGSQKRSRFHHGLIAQEVADVIAETGVDFGGFQDHKVAGGSDVLSIGYEELIAPLIKAVQELSAEIKALKAERA